MDAVSQEVMKRIDTYTCEHLIKSIDLMEAAGTSMASEVLSHYSPKRVLLLVGSSGNGGDALVLGRKLIEKGITVDAYLISDTLSIDCNTNKDRFKGNIYYELPKLDYDLIIDGLIGFGLKSQLRDNYIKLIHSVNDSNIKIVSLDIPTGIDATSGISYGAFIKSDLCITIEYPKTGLFLNDGLDSYKELSIISIGIIKTDQVIHIHEKEEFMGILPYRLRNSNKGSYGRSAILAGSYKYPGASYIAYEACAAFKMGVGYSYLYVPKEVYELYALRHPEVIVSCLSSVDGHIKYDEDILNSLLKMDSISIGMGMDISYDLYHTIEYLLLNYDKTLIIDADALNTLAKYGIDILRNKKCRVILTPHLKEMERLSKISVSDIMKNPLEIAKNFSKMYDVTLILKSASSIITNGVDISISAFGNSSLAKGGSGDMLSGILTGISAYLDLEPYKIASLGSYILGRAAEYAVLDIEEECMSPLDIMQNINKVFKEIKNG